MPSGKEVHAVILSPKFSLATKGLLIFLARQPRPRWFSVPQLHKSCATGGGTVEHAISELIKAGLVEIDYVRSPLGNPIRNRPRYRFNRA